MKERYGYKLPSLTGREVIGLPDFVTVSWCKDGKKFSAEVEPDRALDFIQLQERILGPLDNWELEL